MKEYHRTRRSIRRDLKVLLLYPNGTYLEGDPAPCFSHALLKPDRQCAWCGKMMSGTMEGVTLLRHTEQGLKPYLAMSCSHGICPACAAKCRKREVRSATPAMSVQPPLEPTTQQAILYLSAGVSA